MISVVMASYNSINYIKQQVDSILSNITDKDELIIVDDCSTDGTYELLLDLCNSHKQIKLYRNPSTIGVNNNFEKALMLATGNVVFISDDDDVWLPNKVSKMLLLLENPKISMVVHDCELVDGDLRSIFPSYYKLRNTKVGLVRTIMKPCYRGATMCFKKDLLKHVLPFPKKMDMFYDEWISLMAEKHGKVMMHKDILSLWRRVTKSVSSISLEKNNCSFNPVVLFFVRLKHRMKKLLLILYR